jgi:hypothetical protein
LSVVAVINNDAAEVKAYGDENLFFTMRSRV